MTEKISLDNLENILKEIINDTKISKANRLNCLYFQLIKTKRIQQIKQLLIKILIEELPAPDLCISY